MNLITNKHLLAFKLKTAEVVAVAGVEAAYAQGFIKACTDKQVEPEEVMKVVELLDIHL